VGEVSANLDAEVYWAQVPEWVIIAAISDRAVRLYALLARRANAENQAFPSRGYLAEKLACSRKSVDRALDELLAIGAVTKQSQFADNRQTVNLYTVRAMAGSPVSTGGDTGDAGERATGVPQKQSHKNESHKKPIAAKPRERQPDILFDTLAKTCAIDTANLTASARGALNRAVKELRDVNATPAQITAVAKSYRNQYPNATLTPMALVKHWSAFVRPDTPGRPSVWDTYQKPEWY
jgi:hypothetical protein